MRHLPFLFTAVLFGTMGCGRVGFSVLSRLESDGGSQVELDGSGPLDGAPLDGSDAASSADGGDASGPDSGDAGSTPSPLAIIATGTDHTCVVREPNLWCFGRNRFGSVGLDPAMVTSTDVPTVVPGAWTTTSVGIGLSCGLDTAMDLFCWGSATGVVASFLPTAIAHPQPIASLSTFGDYVCVVDGLGQLICFGSDSGGRFGGATSGNPIALPEGAVSVSAAVSHVCAITESASLYCWGRNGFGELGTGSTGTILPPTRVGNGTYRVVETMASSDPGNGISSFGATCAITLAGELSCWGYNGFNMLTDISAAGISVLSPTQVGARTDWETVSLGRSHGCGIHTDGTLECWGANFRGQLGVGMTDRTERLTPTPVVSSETWATVSSGGSHTCATTTSGDAYCWGLSDFGVLGSDPAAREVGEPLQVPLP